jgi:hypothetical protein
MKKVLLVLIMVGCTAALFAEGIGLSAGLGGNFNAEFTSFALTKDAKDAGMEAADMNGHLVGGGIYAFFDATYVEANVGLLFGNANQDKTDNQTDDEKKGMDVTALKLSLFGKYPIDLGGFTLFPMLGIDGQINMGGKFYGEAVPYEVAGMTIMSKEDFNKMFSFFWIKVGVGVDVPLTEKIYLRPEFLYGIRFNTDDEKDQIDSMNTGTKAVDAMVGHGLDIRLALGFRF